MLLVDDDPAFAKRLAAALAGKGVMVVATLSAADRVARALAERKPDLLAFNLSVLGRRFYRPLLRMRHEYMPELRFFAMAWTEDEEALWTAIADGVDYGIVQPFDEATLLQRILDVARWPLPEPWSTSLPPTFPEPLEEMVTDVLAHLGVPSGLKGHRFLVEAIMAVVRNPELMNAVTRSLYPWVAMRCDSTPRRVERAIRTCIEATWTRGNIEPLEKLFAFQVDPNRGKPTNAAFIARVATEIRLRQNAAPPLPA